MINGIENVLPLFFHTGTPCWVLKAAPAPCQASSISLDEIFRYEGNNVEKSWEELKGLADILADGRYILELLTPNGDVIRTIAFKQESNAMLDSFMETMQFALPQLMQIKEATKPKRFGFDLESGGKLYLAEVEIKETIHHVDQSGIIITERNEYLVTRESVEKYLFPPKPGPISILEEE